MNPDNITVTDERLFEAFTNMSRAVDERKNLRKVIKSEVDKSKIYKAVVKRYYPYLDKVEVKITATGSKVMCKILHRLSGNMIDSFIPEGERVFDDKLKEPCIVPRSECECLVAQIIGDSDWVLLGYFYNRNLAGIPLASNGEYRLNNILGASLNYLCFGNGKLDIKTVDNIKTITGVLDDTKKVEYYSKEEVDAMFEELRKEIDQSKDGMEDVEV